MSTQDAFDGEVEVISRTQVAEGVIELTLGTTGGDALPVWEPGAHIEVIVDDNLIRHYSLCGEPNDPTWTIGVLRSPSSRGGSERVHTVFDIGVRVRVKGPRNRFKKVPAKAYVFVAGGIGITPLLPMLRSAARDQVPWQLHYGGRSVGAMAHAGELQREFGSHVTLYPQDEVGMLPLADIVTAADADTAVYGCGPEPMLAALEELAVGARWNLHLERFVAAALADESDDSAIEVTLVGSGRTIEVPADTTILQAVEQAGVFVMSSCREGICGTCETQVISGDIDHRDSYLTDDERASGDVMMICVSRARGPLELDL